MPSWQTGLANFIARLSLKPLLGGGVSVDEIRSGVARVERLVPRQLDSVTIESEPLSHCEAEWIRPRTPCSDRVVLAFPGGAFITCLPRVERLMLSRLCLAANARGRLVFYRLAPEHPFPAGHDDCIEAYTRLLDSGVAPGRVVIGGVSAGGAMTLAVLLALKDRGVPLPAGAYVLSPVADLSDHRAGSRRVNRRRDPVLRHELGTDARSMYLGGDLSLVSHPYVSPINGDFTGLPPMLFQVGSPEILLDDSRRCVERARAAGVRAEIEVWPGMPHGWQGLAFLPESGQAIDRLADFVRECCP